MKRFTDFLKSKGFYIALGVGVLAFAGLLAVYNYDSTKKEMLEEPAIDLNQPAQLDDVPDAVTPELNDDNTDAGQTAETAQNQDATTPVDSDGAIAESDTAGDTDAKEEETTTEEQQVEVISDAAQPDNGPTIEAGLEYDGEQTLTWPLVGNVILPYSMDTTVYYATLKSYKCNPGMLIAGDEGADVFAAYEGVVTSIEDTKEYGTVVTVNMGNGYEAIYGQLENVCVREGDTVSKAEVIAEVGPVSSYYTEEGNHLYFEIMKDGEPVNPLTLIQ